MTSTDDIPPALEYIWNWFVMLNGCREQGYDIGPISHQEIVAWAWLYRIRPSPAEVSVLRDLDRAFLGCHAKKTNPNAVPESSRPMTPELFDSLFK